MPNIMLKNNLSVEKFGIFKWKMYTNPAPCNKLNFH